MAKSNTIWSPTPLEMNLALVAVLSDPLPEKSDALFIHGSSLDDREADEVLLSVAITAYKEKRIGKIVINGLCEKRNLPFQSYEYWKEFILKNGVPKRDLIIGELMHNTAEETTKLLLLAKKMNWKRIIISSHPHHQLRCFLQAVAVMKTLNFWPKIHNFTHKNLQWSKSIRKPLMYTHLTPVDGKMTTHIQAEFDRLTKYSSKPIIIKGQGKSHIPHATIPEMLNYLESRDV